MPLLFALLTASVSDVSELISPPPNEVTLDLPEEPYNYRIGELPNHIFNSTDPWSGGGVDTVRISSISNNGATLGRVLFYDKILSSTGDVSCGSCHKQELSFADEGAFSEGVDEIMTTRNSMHINDLAWGAFQEQLFWDFRANQLEKMVLDPIANEEELGGPTMASIINNMYDTDYYGPLFEKAYGDPTITTTRIASSISQFIRSMTTLNSKFDQEAANNFAGFSELEMTGKQLFEESCSSCHAAPHFSSTNGFDFFFFPMNNGLDSNFTDLGAGAWTEDPSFDGVFKSPTLRNIALTAPYMHDGRFETLEEVIDFYSDGIQSNPTSAFEWMFALEPDENNLRGFRFDDEEKEALMAFMNTLTDETFATNPKWSNPFVELTSTFSPELLEGITASPNPTKDQTTIELNNPDAKEFQLNLTTIDGKVVRQITTADQQYTLTKGDLSPGVYFLKVTDQRKMATIKIILQ